MEPGTGADSINESEQLGDLPKYTIKILWTFLRIILSKTKLHENVIEDSELCGCMNLVNDFFKKSISTLQHEHDCNASSLPNNGAKNGQRRSEQYSIGTRQKRA